MPRPDQARSPKQRILDRVEKQANGCWIWTGPLNHSGYGYLVAGSRQRGDRKHWLAHRLMWRETHGHLPIKMCVLHRCDTPACVNPEHLFLGTHDDNMADMVAKGRSKACSHAGMRNPAAKLTAAKVRAARHDYRENGVSFDELADRYDVTRHAISDAVYGRTWKSVE
jgi:hypothetical protein